MHRPFRLLTAVVLHALFLLALPSAIAASAPALTTARSCLQHNASFDLCMDTALRDIGEEWSTRDLLSALESLSRTDRTFNAFAHKVAHAIGHRAYERSATFADALHTCDVRFQAGCIHGVIEAAFATPEERARDEGHLSFAEIRDRIPTFCTQHLGADPAAGLRAQCQHGLGHAILYTLDYHLTEALRGCALLPAENDRTNCFLGVFMENTSASPWAKGNLHTDDPLFPCDAIPLRYRAACFLDQTRAMAALGLTREQIAATCNSATPFQRECFRSFGRDLLATLTPDGLRKAAAGCEKYAATFAPSCIEGAVASLVDIRVSAADAYPYCRDLSSQDLQRSCLLSTHTYLSGIYHVDADTMLTECRNSAGSIRRWCEESVAPERPQDPLGWLIEVLWRMIR